MKNNVKKRVMFAALLMAGAVCFGAVVQNPSFETPALANGGSSSGVPSSWTGVSNTITVSDPLSTAAFQPTQGENLLQLGGGNNQIWQDTVIIQPDTLYTFLVDVGVQSTFDPSSGDWYRCAIKYAGSGGNEFLSDTNQNTNWPTLGGWKTVAVEFNSAESPEMVGRTLQIYLAGNNIYFDNVRYSYQPYWDGMFNGGFDYDVVAEGQSNSEIQPSGWLTSGTLELRNPASGETPQPTTGSNYLKITSGNVEYYPEGGIYPQTQYTVQVDVARISGLAGTYQFKLVYHDGSTWHTIAQRTGTASTSWTTVQLQFSSSISITGQLLRVQLIGQGVAYDNCRITETILRMTPASTFYISQTAGNDSDSGLSEDQPWQTFANLDAMRLLPGDQILLKRGDVWDEDMRLWGKGQAGSPIELSVYGTGDKPRIRRTDQVNHRCVVIESPSHWRISNLDFRNAKVGIYLRYNQSRLNEDIVIEDCYFEDMNQTANWNPANYDFELSFNTGVMIGGKIWAFNSYQPILDGLTIRNCGFQRITHSVLANWYYPPRYRNRLRNLIIEDCWQTGGYGVGLFHVNGGQLRRCYFGLGDPIFMPTGTAQGILQTSKNFTIDQCVFEGASRQGGTADGASFDFEGDTESCTFSNNVGYNNDGQSLLILGTGGPNKNLTVKDCVFFNNCKDALHWSGHNYELVTWDALPTGTLQNLTFYRENSYGLYSNTTYFANFSKVNVQNKSLSDIDGRPTYWHFNTDGNIEGWGSVNHLSGLSVGGGRLCMTSTGGDPYLHSPATWIVAAANPVWTLAMSSTAGSWAQVFFITHNDPAWNETKSITVPIVADGQEHRYQIDMRQCPAYWGVVTQIRLDPTVVAGASICVDYLKPITPGSRQKKTSFYPDAYTVLSGSYAEGDLDKLRTKEFSFGANFPNPNDHLKINTPAVSPYTASTEFRFSGLPQTAERLELEYVSHEQLAGTGKTITLTLYNVQTAQWETLGTFSTSTVDVSRRILLDLPGRYIDGAGIVKLRASLVSNVSNSIYHQYVKIIAVQQLEYPGDMDLDGVVAMDDFVWMSDAWGAHPSSPIDGFRDGADINMDGIVDMTDFLEMAATWLN